MIVIEYRNLPETPEHRFFVCWWLEDGVENLLVRESILSNEDFWKTCAWREGCDRPIWLLLDTGKGAFYMCREHIEEAIRLEGSPPALERLIAKCDEIAKKYQEELTTRQ